MILIRADANEAIGAGHIMRCLSIARTFSRRGEETLFITSDHKADALIHRSGFASLCLNSAWDDLEKDDFSKRCTAYRPDLLLVDSYYVTEPYLTGLRSLTPTAYLDDQNARTWDVDILINYNIFAASFDYSDYRGSGTRLILGPQYAPLREEFCGLGEHRIKDVSDVLVSAGGADPERITERIMENVCPHWRTVNFHFVVGTLNPRIDAIKAMAGKTPNAVLHINEGKMSSLMCYCDLAISAAGSTLYELCACGTPTLAYILADNQLPLAKGFSEQGLMLSAGDCRGNSSFLLDLESMLQILIENAAMRKIMSTKIQELVDGRGACRLADELLKML